MQGNFGVLEYKLKNGAKCQEGLENFGFDYETDALCHASRRSQKWLSENFVEHTGPDVWHSTSPDCNPMDFFMWGVVERDINKTSVPPRTS